MENEPVRLFTLEDWVRKLLELPTGILEQRFADWSSAEDEIYALPYFSLRRQQFRRVALPLLENLASKIGGLDCEAVIWRPLLECLEHPLPESVAYDLIERDIEITALGHTRQTDEVQWR
jgi:hypothetical protein